MERREFLKLTGQSALAATILNGAAPDSFGQNADAQNASAAQNATQNAMQNHLIYPLQDGWIHNWLVAGPQNTPVAPAEYKFNAALRAPVVPKFFSDEMLLAGENIEGAALKSGETALRWKVFRCEDDHLIDLSAWHPKSDYVRAWASCILSSPEARAGKFELCTNGPAVMFVGGKRVLSHQEFDNFGIYRTRFEAPLEAGQNLLAVRFDQLMTRNGPHTMALHLENSDGIAVQIPTRTQDVARRQTLEMAFESAYLSRDSYADGQEIRLLVPQLAGNQGKVEVELMSGRDAVRSATWDTGVGASFVSLGRADKLKEGRYAVRLSGADNARSIAAEVARDLFSPATYGNYEERRLEALNYAAREGEGFRREMARMALGKWNEVDKSVISKTIAGAAEWKDGADGEVMNLLGVLIRFGDHPQFPNELKKPIADVALGFRYWNDEPGSTSMTYGSENHQLTFSTAEILAGQLFPDRTFTNNQKSGAWHREHGEKIAAQWLKDRLEYGFDEWDANGYLAADMAILSHLMLAQNPRLSAGAAQIMNKILFGIAVGSWKGSYGTAHSRTQAEYIKDARHEPVSCVSRLMWGLAPGITASARPRRLPLRVFSLRR